MAELKKCPFCGGEAEYNKETEFDTHGDMYTSHYVWCPYPKNGCGARIYGHSKQEAIEQWNNRTTEAEIRAKAIDEFAEKLSDAYSEHSTIIRLHGVDFDILTVDGAIEIMWDLAEQLKEQ